MSLEAPSWDCQSDSGTIIGRPVSLAGTTSSRSLEFTIGLASLNSSSRLVRRSWKAPALYAKPLDVIDVRAGLNRRVRLYGLWRRDLARLVSRRDLRERLKHRRSAWRLRGPCVSRPLSGTHFVSLGRSPSRVDLPVSCLRGRFPPAVVKT